MPCGFFVRSGEVVTRASASLSFKTQISRFTDSGGFGKLLAVKFLRHISTFLRRGILVALGGVSLAAVAVETPEAVVRASNLAPGETCGPIAFR